MKKGLETGTNLLQISFTIPADFASHRTHILAMNVTRHQTCRKLYARIGIDTFQLHTRWVTPMSRQFSSIKVKVFQVCNKNPVRIARTEETIHPLLEKTNESGSAHKK